MNEMKSVDNDNRCPGTSYSDMLAADTRPVGKHLLEESNQEFSNDPVSTESYVSADFAKLEEEKMWPNVWQFAAREDEMPDPGDSVLYEINDRSFVLVRQKDGSVKAFHNVCLHRARKLRTSSGKVSQLKCPFHGFAWNNDGSLKDIPCEWDFKHVEDEDLSLPEVRVNRWQGFIMITENENIPEFTEWVGPSIEHYENWRLDDSYTGMWVARVIPANWKTVSEAFMEAWHSVTTHPQLLPFLGDANTRYDTYGDFMNRAITPSGVLSPHIKGKDQQYILNKMAEFSGGTDSDTNRRFNADGGDSDLPADDPFYARKVLAEANRKGFHANDGQDYSDVTDTEMLDNFTYNIFPNFAPWGGMMPQIVYRWRPWGGVDKCLMEIRLLMRRPKGEKMPRAVEMIRIPDDEPFSWAADIMGESFANVFDQDMSNLPYVQEGMKASPNKKMIFGAYQDSRVRHFHTTLNKFIDGQLP